MKQIIIQESNFEKARKTIHAEHAQNAEIIFSGSDDELNRKILEKEKINVLLISLAGRRDRMKQRDSGFNQVLAKLAKKKGILVGINLDEILNARTEKEKSKILARVEQNIKLCAKDKIKMKFISPSGKNKKDIHDLRAFGLSLGMPTWMITD